MPPDPQTPDNAPLPLEPAATAPSPAPAAASSSSADSPAVLDSAAPAEAVKSASESKPEQKPDAKPAAEIPAPEPTLLEKLGKDDKAEAKPEDKTADKPSDKPADKTAEAKLGDKVEAKPEGEPAEPAKPDPVEYKYTLPDTLKMSDEQKTELHGALDEFRANPAENTQKLIDLHNKAMSEYAENLALNTLANQHKAFAEVRKGWRTQLMADPDMGGAAMKTTEGAVARMRDLAVSSAKEGTARYNSDWSDFNKMLTDTGVGDHPAFWRMLHNFARWLDEPPVPPANPQPTKSNGKNPQRSGIYSAESRAKMNV